MSTVDITGLDKAEVLVALFTAAAPPTGIATANFSAHDTLTIDEANKIFAGYTSDNPYIGQPYHLDYVKGRNLKFNLDGDIVDVSVYDGMNGEGAAAAVIEKLRRQSRAHTPSIGVSVESRDDGSSLITMPDGSVSTYWLSPDGLFESE